MPSNIVVPEMGESIVDARIAKWLKREGDSVSAGEALVELETDKIDVEVSAPEGGVLQKITRGPGDDVKIGEVIGVVDTAATQAPSPTPAWSASAAQAGAAPEPAAAEPSVPSDDEKTRATPSARRLADQHDVEISALKGTGEAGRVTRKDVETYIASRPGDGSQAQQPPPAAPTVTRPVQPAVAPSPWPEAPVTGRTVETPTGERREERIRMSKRRATIARRLVEAQSTAALLTTFNEVDMTGIMSLRERRKQGFKEKHGVSLGIASFFVKASVGALREFPRINAEIQGDEMVLKHYYDIGVAVGAAEGLVVPVLRDADRMSFAAIELRIREFAKKANDGTLTLEDLRGGTFTITNGGVFGSLVSTPIINPPQVGILGLHKIQDRPVAVDGKVEVRPMMYLALTYDHRIVDGAEAVRFLVRVKELAEDPGTLLLES